jgi:hypothetical protein
MSELLDIVLRAHRGTTNCVTRFGVTQQKLGLRTGPVDHLSSPPFRGDRGCVGQSPGSANVS